MRNAFPRAETLGEWTGCIPSGKLSEQLKLEWIQHRAKWWVFPFGWWTEVDGSYVIFDEYRRPICRRRPDRTVEALRSNVRIKHVAERLLYGEEGPSDTIATVKHCLELVERLGIREEIAYRSEICGYFVGCLPGGIAR